MTSQRRPAITRDRITGLILAGGQGSRMGGVDKGLEPLQGRALVEHAIERLRPQVGTIAISANRNVDQYARYGFPVFTDDVSRAADRDDWGRRLEGVTDGHPLPGNAPPVSKHLPSAQAPDGTPIAFAGPLAGIAQGLARIDTEWMLVVPCDAPLFPDDLAAQLAEALIISTADLALAATIEPDGARQRHPVFALIPRRLAGSAETELLSGARKLDAWYRRHNAVEVSFRDSRAFYNANTLRDLRELER
jgi:molybdenum cofactor guanylyltransferase